MFKKIHKITLGGERHIAELPIGSEILHVSEQHGVPTLWYLFVDDENTLASPEKEIRKINVYGTGHEIPMCMKYIGTYFSGAFVWHVFEDLQK